MRATSRLSPWTGLVFLLQTLRITCVCQIIQTPTMVRSLLTSMRRRIARRRIRLAVSDLETRRTPNRVLCIIAGLKSNNMLPRCTLCLKSPITSLSSRMHQFVGVQETILARATHPLCVYPVPILSGSFFFAAVAGLQVAACG